MITSLFNKRRKKQKLFSFYKKFINEGDLCFDIGANIGERTETFLQLGAKVITVEPQPQCMKILKQKFSNSGNVEFVEAAISSEKGINEMFICEVNECSSISKEFINFYSTNFNKLKWNSSIMVTTITLDELIKVYDVPLYCKIDVEGFEQKVFEGLSVPIKNIGFEFNLPFISETIECVNILDRLGNPLFNYIAFEKMEIVLNEWQNADEFKNTLSNIQSNILTGEILVKFEQK